MIALGGANTYRDSLIYLNSADYSYRFLYMGGYLTRSGGYRQLALPYPQSDETPRVWRERVWIMPKPYVYVPVPLCIQAELYYTYLNQVCQNVLHYQYTTPIDNTVFSALGSALVSWWDTNIKGVVRSDVSLTQIKLTDLTTQDGSVVYYSTGLPKVGTYATGTTLPTGNTLAIKLNTAKRGRSFRGRIYHVGLDTVHVTGNQVTAAFADAMRIAYSLLNLSAITGNPAWSVLSRVEKGAWRPIGVTTQITNVTVDLNIDSQRRRLTSRGR